MSSALIAAFGNICSWRNYLSEGTLILDEAWIAEEHVLWQIIQVFNKTELISLCACVISAAPAKLKMVDQSITAAK